MLECTRCRLGILLLLMVVVTMAMMTATMMVVDVGSAALLLMAVLGSGRSRAADTDDWQGSLVMEGGDGVRMAGATAVAQRTNGQFTRSRQTLAGWTRRPRSSMAVLLALDRWTARWRQDVLTRLPSSPGWTESG
jgi:hypothetical protein